MVCGRQRRSKSHHSQSPAPMTRAMTARVNHRRTRCMAGLRRGGADAAPPGAARSTLTARGRLPPPGQDEHVGAMVYQAASPGVIRANRRRDHIIDRLIEERAPRLAAGAAWPILRPLLYGVLDYGKARRMA